MSYGVRWVSPDGKTGRWTAPFATREDAESHAALRQMENGLSYTVEEIGLSPTEAKPQPRITMSYRVRYTFPDGRTGHWAHEYQTREEAQQAIYYRQESPGTYYVEEVPDAPQWKEEPPRWMREIPRETIMKIDNECLRAISAKMWDAPKLVEVPVATPEPVSMAAHHVEILRKRIAELEEVQKAMHRDLLFALETGQAMRDAMRTGEWCAGHDRSMANSAMAGWDRWKASLAKAPSVPVGASDAPGEGGDSDLRRLEALRAFLEDNEDASLSWWEGEFNALAEGVTITAPTLLALADKLAEREDKP